MPPHGSTLATHTDDARLAGIAQLAEDLTAGLSINRIGSIGRQMGHSTTNMEPSIRIEARCKNGHETYMYPKDCVKLFVPEQGDHRGQYTYIGWECARCPKDDYHHEVEL